MKPDHILFESTDYVCDVDGPHTICENSYKFSKALSSMLLAPISHIVISRDRRGYQNLHRYAYFFKYPHDSSSKQKPSPISSPSFLLSLLFALFSLSFSSPPSLSLSLFLSSPSLSLSSPPLSLSFSPFYLSLLLSLSLSLSVSPPPLALSRAAPPSAISSHLS